MSNDKPVRIFAQHAQEIEVTLTDEQVKFLARDRLLKAIGIQSPFPSDTWVYLSKDKQNIMLDVEFYEHGRQIKTEILRPATDDDRTVFAALEILRRA